ncbi:MAG: hypothetical protein Q7U04_13645 [Bacteriovorax sp.]|nr:hypothetical protein [Bacteriovorax sp.]
MLNEFNQQIEFELLDFIQKHYGHEVFTPGLDRTRALYLTFLDKVKYENVKVSIIAGTNGKGQTAHTLTHLLASVGDKVALWTSPHILSLRERFHFKSKGHSGDITYQELRDELYAAHKYLQLEHQGLQVSFYEFLFLVFLRLSFKEKIDHLVLEVGLGGRLDAVNHFDADCTCITSISRDHQAILGNRFDLILSEKIAVARAQRPLFTNFKLDYLNALTGQYCQQKDVLWHALPTKKNQSYFEDNQDMARALFQYLKPQKFWNQAGGIPIFKGRREEMTFNGNTLIFIGAHNIDGMRRMLELFSAPKSYLKPDYLLISFSKRPINEVEVMLKSLVDCFGNKARLGLASFEHPKALGNEQLLEVYKNNKINKGLLDFVTDWKTDLNKSKNQKIVVCGSYYFIGEVQRYLCSLP